MLSRLGLAIGIFMVITSVPGRLARTARRWCCTCPATALGSGLAAAAQHGGRDWATGPGLTPDHRPYGPDRRHRQWKRRADRRHPHAPSPKQQSFSRSRRPRTPERWIAADPSPASRGPSDLPRLVQIEINTRERLQEAHQMQWLGEVSGLHDSLRHIADKKQQAERLRQLAADNDSNDHVLG